MPPGFEEGSNISHLAIPYGERRRIPRKPAAEIVVVEDVDAWIAGVCGIADARVFIPLDALVRIHRDQVLPGQALFGFADYIANGQLPGA